MTKRKPGSDQEFFAFIRQEAKKPRNSRFADLYWKMLQSDKETKESVELSADQYFRILRDAERRIGQARIAAIVQATRTDNGVQLRPDVSDVHVRQDTEQEHRGNS